MDAREETRKLKLAAVGQILPEDPYFPRFGQPPIKPISNLKYEGAVWFGRRST